MYRDNLLSLLEEYTPFDENEGRFKYEMISFIKENPNCFERSLEEGHITASSWLLDYTGDFALLTHHAKLDNWYQLGGHCDGDPDVLSVAIKEAQEESGVNQITPITNKIFDIDIHLIPDNSKEKAHYHFDIRFLLQMTINQKVKENAESKALQWIGKDIKKLPTNNPSIIRMFNKWINYKHN